ncbi:MAG TPA: hypothetical protein VGD99_04280 [Anaerolineae bacterium]
MPQTNNSEPRNKHSTVWLDLPPGFNIETSPDRLIITRKWFSPKYIGLAIFALSINVMLVLLVATANFWLYVFLPHTWAAIGTAYYALTGILNTMTITVTASRIMVEHGPIPYPGNIQLKAKHLSQLYTKEINTRTRTYEVRMKTVNGQDLSLVRNLDYAEQARYLENQIEEFLGIEDEPVAGELNYFATKNQRTIPDSWQRFARINQLDQKAYGVGGIYHGYEVSLMPHHDGSPGWIKIHLTLAVKCQANSPSSGTTPESERSLTKDDVAGLFNPTHLPFSLKGKVSIQPNGREIVYEEPGLKASSEQLQSILDTLCRLIAAYPRIVALGGEVVPVLQPIAAEKEYLLQSFFAQLPQEKDHPLRSVAVQLIEDIAQNTAPLQRQLKQLLCKRCLARCTAHTVSIPGMDKVKYYGCRLCHQNSELYEVDRVIAVLDTRMAAEPVQHNQTLCVNWLANRTLFDFDDVEIIEASDLDVERFVVQVGNDTDPVRRVQYGRKRCSVSAQSQISLNSRRILQKTFGQIMG